jgi:hypothetical protein
VRSEGSAGACGLGHKLIKGIPLGIEM